MFPEKCRIVRREMLSYMQLVHSAHVVNWYAFNWSVVISCVLPCYGARVNRAVLSLKLRKTPNVDGSKYGWRNYPGTFSGAVMFFILCLDKLCVRLSNNEVQPPIGIASMFGSLRAFCFKILLVDNQTFSCRYYRQHNKNDTRRQRRCLNHDQRIQPNLLFKTVISNGGPKSGHVSFPLDVDLLFQSKLSWFLNLSYGCMIQFHLADSSSLRLNTHINYNELAFWLIWTHYFCVSIMRKF